MKNIDYNSKRALSIRSFFLFFSILLNLIEFFLLKITTYCIDDLFAYNRSKIISLSISIYSMLLLIPNFLRTSKKIFLILSGIPIFVEIFSFLWIFTFIGCGYWFYSKLIHLIFGFLTILNYVGILIFTINYTIKSLTGLK